MIALKVFATFKNQIIFLKPNNPDTNADNKRVLLDQQLLVFHP